MVSYTRATIALQTLLVLLCLIEQYAADTWRQVKPMYLLSMDREFEEYSGEPTVLSLEADPVEPTSNDGIQAMDRIFGGKVAERHSFPYQAGLLLQRPKGLYWCGGALISDEYILTAAHCVDMAKRALVFLGAHEIKNANEVGQVRIMVKKNNFIIFPSWNPRRLKDDIALVRLPVPIGFNDRIHPIPLPQRSYEYQSFENKLAIASGWGRYAMGAHAISNVLRYVKLRIIDGHTCKKSFPISYRSTNICTSGKYARSTCNGDSGGPLVIRRRYSKKRILIGLTSFGSIHGCNLGYPAAFTKVAAYLDWITDVTGIDPWQDSSNAITFKDILKDYRQKYNKYVHQDEDSTEEEEEDEDWNDSSEDVGEYIASRQKRPTRMGRIAHESSAAIHPIARYTVPKTHGRYLFL